MYITNGGKEHYKAKRVHRNYELILIIYSHIMYRIFRPGIQGSSECGIKRSLFRGNVCVQSSTIISADADGVSS